MMPGPLSVTPSRLARCASSMFAVLGGWAALIVVGCSSENSFLEGDCANGYFQFGNRCIPADGGGPTSDASDSGDATVPPSDGSAPTEGGGSGEGRQPPGDGSATDGSLRDGGCQPPTPNDCNGVCVDITSDPKNCGACDNVCPSLICSASTCVGLSAAKIVVLGHDYAEATLSDISLTQQLILTNSIGLAGGSPIEVWGFEQYADPNAISIVKQILSQPVNGRNINYTAVDSSQIETGLSTTTVDLLLVYDQTNSPPGTMATLGTNWQSVLAQFISQAGVVLVMDGAVANADGGSAEMPLFTSSANLLQIAGHTPIANGTALTIIARTDAIGNGPDLTSPYSAAVNTASLTVTETPPDGGSVIIVPVVTNGTAATSTNWVVVHKTL